MAILLYLDKEEIYI